MEHHQEFSFSAKSFSRYASVIFEDVKLDHPLDYGIPKEMDDKIRKGHQVEAPLRGVLRKGLVVEIKNSSSFAKILPLHSISKEEELISEDLYELAVWIAKYYCCPLRRVLKMMIPSSIRNEVCHKEQHFVKRAKPKEFLRAMCLELREKNPSQAHVLETLLVSQKGIFLSELMEKTQVSKSPIVSLEKKGFLLIEKVRIDRSPLVDEEYFKTKPKLLNPEQRATFDTISLSLEKKEFKTHLLFGITGSGKTEIYLQTIEKGLTLGISAIMLVPEISLTGQTIERLRSRFDDQIAILHHRLSNGQRHDEWLRLKTGKAKIAVGARSALFSPIQNLGLIIVDEEHDQAYKQSDEAPCYHARDVAVMRGKICNATVVLGTATPSLESYTNAQIGKYTLSKLSNRATDFGLPKVTIVDMKKEYEKARGYTSFSGKLIESMKERLEKGEQTILFLNRRGYHTSLNCNFCGHIFKCPHCDLAMTYHLEEKNLSCHLCGFLISPPPSSCTQCNRRETLKFKGVGTEQIERALYALFPSVRTLRIDSDTTRHKGSHERLFRQFSTHKADILIGTQMVSKGLHFPSVTLVAVLNCDSSLQIPDFRSSEQVFQLITQVAGRAGRGSMAGEVILQTQMPENPTIQVAASQDYESFFQMEVETRKMFGFPPFTHFIKLIFKGPSASETENFANRVKENLSLKLKKNALVHPVIASGHAKVKDHFRFQFLIRTSHVYLINDSINSELTDLAIPKEISLRIDVDPLSTFF